MTPEGRLGVLVGDRINITCEATNDCNFHRINLWIDDATIMDCGSSSTTFLNCPISITSVQQNGSQQQCHGLLTDNSKPFSLSLILLVQG